MLSSQRSSLQVHRIYRDQDTSEWPERFKGEKNTAQDTEGPVEPIFRGFQSMHVLHVSRRIAIICQETTPESQSL